jgi:hypothetical protein
MSHGSCRITSCSQIIDFIFNDISQCKGHTTNRIKFKHTMYIPVYSSETCLDGTSLEPTYVFRIDRCSVYIG